MEMNKGLLAVIRITLAVWVSLTLFLLWQQDQYYKEIERLESKVLDLEEQLEDKR